MNLKTKVALATGYLGGRVSRALHLGGGTSLPGAIALRLDADIIGRLAERLDRGPVLITATNGKTTTANMLASICRAEQLKVVHNAAGANLAFGVAAALMAGEKQGLTADTDETIGLFEVDEATVKNVTGQLKPQVFTVGNIFRDQLDRFGEVDETARLIAQGIDFLDDRATLVLNADDPRVAALGREASQSTLYFGLETAGTGAQGGAQDSKDCLICGEPLVYSERYFSHLGKYACQNCGFTRPPPAVTAINLKLSLSETKFTLVTPSGEAEVVLPVPALYNVYNALAAAAAALASGISLNSVVSGLNDFTPAFGRFETITVADRRVRLMLIKNPTGFDQAIEALHIETGPKNILIAINDNLADGTDVSWLWDVGLERLGPTGILAVSGTRAYDMAVRLKYAGVAEATVTVEPDLGVALESALSAVPPGSELFVLPTYTALLDLRRHLEKVAGVSAFWSAREATAGREGGAS